MDKCEPMCQTCLPRFSQSSGSQSVINASAVDPSLIADLIPLVILSLSGINAMAIKVSQGGLFKTVWFNAAVLCVIGGLISYASDIFLSGYLGNIFDSQLFGSTSNP